ncbi:unnamed protein product [Jaminaea pallidilutea]
MAPPPYPVLSTESPRPVRGLSIRSQEERRLNDFVGGQFAKYNLSSVLFEDRSDDPKVIAFEKWSPPAGQKPPFDVAKKQRFVPAHKGDTFGPSWSNHWLKMTLNIPKKWSEKEMLELELDPSCEAMIFSNDGKAFQGITGGYEKRRVDFPIKPELRGKTSVLYAEISCNGMFGLPADKSGDPDPNRYFPLVSADVVVKRPQAWRLLWDWEILQGCVDEMPRDGVLQNKALWICNRIMSTFRKDDLASLDRCRKLAEEVFGKDWEKQGEKLYQVESPAPALIHSLGHTHIDTAWLWPFSATQQKIARSWSTQLDLMERYPEYKFTASTAQQYAWLEELYPELFERVKKQVQAGRFIPIGGTWVENDANMPSGEAFVRQFLYGQRYFESRFGKRCNIFWLPDSFGYNAQIPQLARSAGCDYWFTQKLSWSNINKFPHNTFVWVGLDGTQIVTHMTPVDNYDSQCGTDDLRKAVWNNKNLNVQPKALQLYGWGDGGGGPTAPNIEKLRRARAAHNAGFTEMPKVHVGGTAEDFYEDVLKITDQGNRLPTWQGEIYLEFHRGVQTSHGSIKKWNRKLEILLHNVEWVATLASIQAKSQYRYPKNELDSLWEQVLKCQFHDVLPGSSIRLVYDDAERIYADVNRRAKVLLRKASDALSNAAGTLVYANPLAVARRELVSVSLAGKPITEVHALEQNAVQLSPDGSRAIILVEDLKQEGRLTLTPSPVSVMRKLEAVSIQEGDDGSHTLRNSNLIVKVAEGRITSIFDVQECRELVARGRSAGLVICEDFPSQFDAWDTDIWSLDTLQEIRFDTAKVTERGPWRATLTLETTFGQGTKVRFNLSLDAVPATAVSRTPEDARSSLRIDAKIDWKEKHRFLRFEVPTSLQADSASFETQFGVTKRPTTRNTTWEAAKFEVCGHKFSDLSEAQYGLAILNDCKYGHSAEGGALRLSLLKGATYPDAHQDEGEHTLAFALYPHKGNLAQSDVVTAARIFNNPVEIDDGDDDDEDGSYNAMASSRRVSSLLARSASTTDDASTATMPFTVEQPPCGSVVLDTMKRGEADFDYYGRKGNTDHKTVVLRLYESLGTHAEVTLKSAREVVKMVSCNVLEDEDKDEEAQTLEQYEMEDGSTNVFLTFRPFEVRTVKVYLSP